MKTMPQRIGIAGLRHEISDDRHTRGSRVQNLARVRPRDASDRDGRQTGEAGAQPEFVEANYWIRVRFVGRSKDRAQCEVIDGKLRAGEKLTAVVRRKPKHGAGTQKLPRHLRWQIVLAEMDPLGGGHHR